MSISNVPVDLGLEVSNDFYFHFLTVMRAFSQGDFPPGARFPDHPFHCEATLDGSTLPVGIGDLTTPGCSNTTYP